MGLAVAEQHLAKPTDDGDCQHAHEEKSQDPALPAIAAVRPAMERPDTKDRNQRPGQAPDATPRQWRRLHDREPDPRGPRLRLSLAHQVIDMAVAGSQPDQSTYRYTAVYRSTIVCAASRLKGTSKTRSNAFCGPPGQTAGAKRSDRQPYNPKRATDCLKRVELVNEGQASCPHRSVYSQRKRHGGQLDHAEAATSSGEPVGDSYCGKRSAAPICQPCDPTIKTNQGKDTTSATARASRPSKKPGFTRRLGHHNLASGAPR